MVTPDYQPESLLTTKQLGDYLGVSKSSVYRMIERREIPFYKLRCGLRFRLSDVEKFLEENLVVPIKNENEYGSTKN